MADKTVMKRLIPISVVLVVTCASLASGQSTGTRPLADVAKAEEARRKDVSKPAKVLTNNDLKPDISKGVAGPSTITPVTDPAKATPGNATPGAPAAAAKPAGGANDQAYWAGRMKEARDKQQRLQMFADSLQTRINSLTTDFINRDDPAQKAKLEADRKAALAELDRVRKEMDDQTKAMSAIEDEARRAGAPAGWLRPGA
jgi:hypothetical protein